MHYIYTRRTSKKIRPQPASISHVSEVTDGRGIPPMRYKSSLDHNAEGGQLFVRILACSINDCIVKKERERDFTQICVLTARKCEDGQVSLLQSEHTRLRLVLLVRFVWTTVCIYKWQCRRKMFPRLLPWTLQPRWSIPQLSTARIICNSRCNIADALLRHERSLSGPSTTVLVSQERYILRTPYARSVDLWMVP